MIYDAKMVEQILGLPCNCEPTPEQSLAKDEVLIYYGGWDLQTLRSSTAGKKRMWQDQNWYDDKGWKAEPGYYRVLLRVPDSNRRNWNEQLSHLKTIDEALQPTPVTVAATALLVHLTKTGNDLLRSDWCRCAEPLPGGHRAALAVPVDLGRVLVYDRWDIHRNDCIWLSTSRKS